MMSYGTYQRMLHPTGISLEKNKKHNAYTAADGSIPIYPINDKVDLG